MRGAIIYAPGDVRVEERDDPTIIHPTDAIIRLSATCVCGSDLWPYRGIEPVDAPTPMGHEYVGVVQETGTQVTTIKPGDFVIGSFMASDGTCEICQAGYQSRCAHVEFAGAGGAQAEYLRVPLADGTLVATHGQPDANLIPSLLAASDVLGTGWFGAVAADAGPGKTVAVVGDGAVGLLAVLASRQLGAERIIAMSRHESRQKLALEFGATDIVTERGEEGVAHGVELPGEELFYAEVHLHGGPAPVRRFLPDLIRRIEDHDIDPGKVFDLTLPLDQAAEGYRAMDERRAIKTLLRP
jgi:threonine dehydrogenase-like Zn-dependent dehydrogenase